MYLANECFNRITSGCDYFMTSGIPYHTGAADYPFIDPTMCLDNGSYVIGFRTDPINARKTVNVHSCPYFVLRSKSLYQQKAVAQSSLVWAYAKVVTESSSFDRLISITSDNALSLDALSKVCE